uniref:adenylate cyclase n=1 Tax=Glossina pallidipes TaxID=7398 RepID=A0A1A9ZAQ4_GLOPL
MEVKMDYSFDDMREHYDLKEEIMDMNLESVYQSYMRKIKRNYLGTFTIVHLVIAIVHSLETYDVYFYIIGAILTCLSIRPFMSEKYAKSHRGVPFIVSWIAGFTMALTEAILSTDAVVKKSLSIILPDFLYLVALNVVGLYICRRQEIATRSVFLSKRQRLEQTLYWKNAKDQRKGLLDNIIPAQIAKSLTREIEQRIAKTFEGTRGSKDEKLGGKIFIETHTDVTIIFADIVNYTFLTTRVDVKTLVETLHELFQKFDQACQASIRMTYDP